jgi:hypothetical protein
MQELLGRGDELAELEDALDRALRGEGGLCLLVGEPGIGKTRLAEELVQRAQTRGAEAVWGRCWDGGGAPAYWPWTQILGRLLGAADPDAFAADRGLLGHIVPELRPDGAAAPPLAAEARFDLYRAVAGAIRQRAAATPQVIVLDDLHVADLSSLQLLQFVARELRSTRALVLGTYRDVEARLTPELGAALARLGREGRTTALRRLDRDAVRTWLEASAGPVAPRLEQLVFQTTQGNPLFVDEIVRLLVSQGLVAGDAPASLPIPYGVREAIRQHLDLLPPGARAVLEVAAVLGGEVESGLLAAACGESPSGVADILAAAVAAGVLVDRGAGRHRFGHALIAEVLVRDLMTSRRRAIHLAAAAALEALSGADRVGARSAEIAHHLIEGGAIDRAADHAEFAAAAFSAAGAADEAARMLARAAAALAPLPDRERRRAELLLAQAAATMQAGQVRAGKALCVEAAALARRLSDPIMLARAALAHGSEIQAAHLDQDLIRLLEEALAALGDREPALSIRLMARLAGARTPSVDPSREIATGREAIARARQLGDAATLAAAIGSAMAAFIDYVDPAERAELNRELVSLQISLGEPVAHRTRLRLFIDLIELDELAEAERVLRECELDVAERRAGHFRWRLALCRATLACARGDFAAAEAAHQDARALRGDLADDPSADFTFALQRWGILATGERHDELVEHALAIPPARIIDGMSYERLWVAAALARAGRGAEAARALPAWTDNDALMRAETASTALAAEVAIAAGDRAAAERLYGFLVPHQHRSISWGLFGMHWYGPTDWILGRLAALLGRPDEAARRLAAARARAASIGARPHEARIAADQAELLARSEARPADAAVPPPSDARFRIRRDGEVWAIDSAEGSFHLKNSRGLEILAHLVDRPGEEIHCLELAAGDPGDADRGDAGELIDREARDAYRARLADLRGRLDEAEERADLGRAERLRAEIDALTGELARGLGLGGKPRRAGSAAERARIAVQRRVRDAIKKIAEHAPRLGATLDATVRTGTYCSYRPLA